MRIKKVNQTVATVGQIVNEASDSTVDTYSCKYIDDNKQPKAGAWQTCTPSMKNCTATYTTQWGRYKYIDEKTIFGSVVLRGKITAVSSPGYATIDPDIPSNFQSDSWYSFCVIYNMTNATNETPFSAGIAGKPAEIGIESAVSGGSGACSWKSSNDTFYISIRYIAVDVS